jgi:hypothetical protein
MGLVFTCIYENTVTSKLIVPSHIKIIEDLVDQVDAGYKVEYRSYLNATFDFKSYFSQPFIRRNMSHKFRFEDDFIPIHQSLLFKRYGNSDFGQKLALETRGIPIHITETLLTLKTFTQIKNCFSIKSPVNVGFQFGNFRISEQEEFVKMIGRFWQSGLIQFWSDLTVHLNDLVLKTGHYLEKPNDVEESNLITLSALASLFLFWAVMVFGVSFLIIFIGIEMRREIIKGLKEQYREIRNAVVWQYYYCLMDRNRVHNAAKK